MYIHIGIYKYFATGIAKPVHPRTKAQHTGSS